MSSYSSGGQKAPKLLPCLHTFCLECVKGFGRRQCGICRKSFGSVEDLTDNFLALENIDSAAIQEGRPRLCEECDDGDSTHRCVNCCRYLCLQCKTQHTRAKATKSHVLKTMEELRMTPWELGTHTAELCNEPGHGEQRINMYCITCSKLVCMQCIVLDHQRPEHEYSSIEQAFVSEAGILHTLIEEIERKESRLDSAEKEINSTIKELKNNSDTATAAIKAVFENLSRTLLMRQNQLLHDIDTVYQKKSEALNSQVESMKAASEQMRGAQTFVDHALRSGSKSLVLKMKNTINDALSEAKVASRSLLVLKDNPVLSFDAGGIHEIEASINNLGRIDVGRKQPQPLIMASDNGARPVTWGGGNQTLAPLIRFAPQGHERGATPLRPIANQNFEQESQVVWAVQSRNDPQPRYSVPAGSFATVFPDPPITIAGIQSAQSGHVYAGAIAHQSSGTYEPHMNVAVPAQQAVRYAGAENLQPPTAIWGGTGGRVVSNYSTLD